MQPWPPASQRPGIASLVRSPMSAIQPANGGSDGARRSCRAQAQTPPPMSSQLGSAWGHHSIACELPRPDCRGAKTPEMPPHSIDKAPTSPPYSFPHLLEAAAPRHRLRRRLPGRPQPTLAGGRRPPRGKLRRESPAPRPCLRQLQRSPPRRRPSWSTTAGRAPFSTVYAFRCSRTRPVLRLLLLLGRRAAGETRAGRRRAFPPGGAQIWLRAAVDGG